MRVSRKGKRKVRIDEWLPTLPAQLGPAHLTAEEAQSVYEALVSAAENTSDQAMRQKAIEAVMVLSEAQRR
jgi:hypothetical protein